MKALLLLAVALLVSVEAWAAPFVILNGGSNGTTDKSSVGIEVGGTRVIMDQFPLSAELSMNFDFSDVPSDTHFNFNRFNETYTNRQVNDGPEIGYLFKSGVNLDDWVNNLTLQVGVGYALQSRITVATGTVSGRHWQQGEEGTSAHLIGYGGILYRLQNICLTLGYNNRRGLVGGIGSTW